MFNQDEIKIAQIKDLRLIYYFECDQSLKDSDNPYFGLKIVYDNDKTLTYTYKDKYFNEYISKVIEVYNKEKDLGNLRFLDDNTRSLFEDINNFSKIKIDYNYKPLQDFKMSCFNSRKMDLAIITPYVKDLIIKFLWTIRQSENIRIKSFQGINDRFLCQYMIKNKNFAVPMIITKNDYNNYLVDFSYNNGNTLMINGEINLMPNYIISEWLDKDKTFMGKNIYHIDDDKFEKYVNTAKGQAFYDNTIRKLSNQDFSIISKFWRLLALDNMANIKKTLDNCYILTNKEKINDNSDLFVKEVAYATFDVNVIDIILKKDYGVDKFNNQLFVSLDEEIVRITARLENIGGLNILIVQKSFLPSLVANGVYKKDFENRYEYDIYVIDSNNLLDSFNILNKIELDEPINSMYQLRLKIKDYKGV